MLDSNPVGAPYIQGDLAWLSVNCCKFSGQRQANVRGRLREARLTRHVSSRHCIAWLFGGASKDGEKKPGGRRREHSIRAAYVEFLVKKFPKLTVYLMQ
jgi:hypothetical protein